MTRLPSLTARDIGRALKAAGFEMVRQSGSHRLYRHPSDTRRRVVVPHHGGRDIKPGTLRSIIRQAGLDVGSFVALL